MPDEAEVTQSGVGRRMFGAFSTRDYRLLWFGMAVSNIGSWMQLVALGWQVYLLTDSPFYLGLVGLARALPVFVFALLGGVVADRFDRRWVMLGADVASLVFALILGYVTLSGVATVWHVIVLALLTAASFSFEVPARQSWMPELVPREQMVNAIGLNAAAFNGAGVIGPTLAALVIGTVGLGAAYLINAASFLAVIVALLMMRSTSRGKSSAQSGMFDTLMGWLRYVWRTPVILVLVMTVAVVSLLSRPYVQLMPVFARDVLGGDATNLGILLAASGLGAFGGSLLVAYLGSFRRRGVALLGMGALFALCLLAFAFSHWLAVSVTLSAVAGFASTFYMATTNTMLQVNAPPALRGRVISVYSLVVMGFMPLGGMLLGSVGSVIGVPITLALGSAVTLIWMAGVTWRVPNIKSLD